MSAPDAVTYSISRDGKELIAPSPLSLTLADGRVLGRKASVRKASAKSVDEIIEAPFYQAQRPSRTDTTR